MSGEEQASSGVEVTGLTLALNSAVLSQLAAVIVSNTLGHSMSQNVYRIADHDDRVFDIT
jgi:hypothetical protein